MKSSMLKNRRTNPKMDYFEQLPDELLLHIIDSVVSDDINALFRLRALSHRFNSLVIDKTKHLFLQADKFERIFDTDLGHPILQAAKKFDEIDINVGYYPSCYINFRNRKEMVLLRCFNHVTKLVIELPAYFSDYMNPRPKHEVKCMYKATFGKNLKSGCTILCYLSEETYPVSLLWRRMDVMHFLSEKCACMAMNIVPHLENLVSLVVKDSKGDLELVMDEEEIREARNTYNDDASVVTPGVYYTYRLIRDKDVCIDIGGGLRQGTLVLAVLLAGHVDKKIDDAEEADLIKRAFGNGVHIMASEKLLHKLTLKSRLGRRNCLMRLRGIDRDEQFRRGNAGDQQFRRDGNQQYRRRSLRQHHRPVWHEDFYI